MRTAFVSSIKYLVLILLIFIFLIGSTKSVSAQNTTQQSQYITPNTNSDVPNNLHTWTQNVMLEVMSAMACQLTGIDPTTMDHKCLGTDPKTGKIGYVEVGKGGILGFVSNSIVTLYTPPAHSGDYIRYLAGSFGIAKPALAQITPTPGYGVNSLAPLTKLWVVFRNFVYLMYVLVFIVIGLAIMFRVKIDPRTVMSIQNQIPKIIVSLILVTFSFAIAGFLIDLMYAVSYLAIGIITSADQDLLKSTPDISLNLMRATNPIDAVNLVTNSSHGFAGISSVSGPAANAIGGHLGDLFDNSLGKTLTGALTGFFGIMIGSLAGESIPIIGSVVGSIIGYLTAPLIAGTLISIVVFLIIVVAIIAALFRLWFQLIIAYVSILIDIIFAPIWIIAGLVPGSKINFSAWLRDLLANLSAFPVVLAMFALARVFMDAFTDSSGKGLPNTFLPPLIGNPAGEKEIGALIALGIILTTPSVVKLMKSVFKTPGTNLGPIMEGLTSGFGLISSPTKRLGGALFGEKRNGDKRVLTQFFANQTQGTIKQIAPRFPRAAKVARRFSSRFKPPTAPIGNARQRSAAAVMMRVGRTNPTLTRKQRIIAAIRRRTGRGGGNPPPTTPPPTGGTPPTGGGTPPAGGTTNPFVSGTVLPSGIIIP